MTVQSKPVSRRWLYIPFAVASVIFFAYFVLWRIGAGEMEKAADQWINDQRAMGLEVTHEGISRDGFPFFLRINILEPMISESGVWRWRADGLSIDALPYDLTRVIFSPTGEQQIFAAGYGEWRFTANNAKASIASDKSREWVFSVTITDAEAQQIAGSANAAIDSLIFDLAPAATAPTTLVLTLAANGIDINANDAAFHLGALQSVFGLTQTQFLFGPDAATQWRNAGGALIINGLFAEIAETKLNVTGEIGLDAADYPAGLLNAEIINPAGLTKWLSMAGALPPDEAEAARAGLTLMAIAGGGKISAPVEFRDGAAEIAGVKLADLPPVH